MSWTCCLYLTVQDVWWQLLSVKSVSEGHINKDTLEKHGSTTILQIKVSVWTCEISVISEAPWKKQLCNNTKIKFNTSERICLDLWESTSEKTSGSQEEKLFSREEQTKFWMLELSLLLFSLDGLWSFQGVARNSILLTTMHYNFIPYCLTLLHISVFATILENCYKIDTGVFKWRFSFL